MVLPAHRTALLPQKLLSLDTLSFLRAVSTSTVAGTYPYAIPNSFAPPPYPYGPSTRYRRRDSGLYGATTIQYGNLVSDQNEHKSRRVWRPNVHNKKLWSNYLGRFVQVKVVTRVLRTIDKLGGLDEYLVGSDAPARIKELGVTGWGLRWRVMQTKGYRDRVAAERRALGLPEKGWLLEEEERKRRERREGMRAAEAYLKALKAEVEAKSRDSVEKVEEEVEEASINFMEEGEASALEQDNVEQNFEKNLKAYTAEQAEADERKDQEPEASANESEFEIVHEQDKFEEQARNNAAQSVAEPIDPATPSHAMPSPSEQLFTQLIAVAAQLRITPDFLINQARAMIQNRTTQLAVAADRKAQLATERDVLVSELDAALASPRRGPILTFHATQLAIARSENALQREREGKRPLTRDQIELNVTGPPFNIPADKWAEVRARVKAIQREQSKQLRERRERHARNVERKQYFETHREEILAELKRKKEAMGLARRMWYSLRSLERKGKKARLGGGRSVEKKGLWTRIKGLFGRKKSK